jgi:hypothetical protein
VRWDDLPGAVGDEGTLLLLHGGYHLLGRIGTAHGFSIGDRLLERRVKTLVEVVIGLGVMQHWHWRCICGVACRHQQ